MAHAFRRGERRSRLPCHKSPQFKFLRIHAGHAERAHTKHAVLGCEGCDLLVGRVGQPKETVD
jgi:hypothetical protein